MDQATQRDPWTNPKAVAMFFDLENYDNEQDGAQQLQGGQPQQQQQLARIKRKLMNESRFRG